MSEQIKHLDDYYDHEKQSDIGFELEQGTIRKRFVLEYCDNPKKFDRLGKVGVEIDDVYDRIIFEEKETDRFRGFESIAYQRYLFYLFNPKILDVKMWEEIYENGTMIQERFIAMPATFPHEFGKAVSRDVMENRDTLRKENEELKQTLATYTGFIKKYNADNTYQEYLQGISSEKESA